MMPKSTVLQIVPRVPGSYDGVGDYALTLAKTLSARHGINTIFGVAENTLVNSRGGFEVVPGLASGNGAGRPDKEFDHVILHYANYGYQSRGVPFQLRNFARRLRKNLKGSWVTTFHELYASGPPWQSAFWLRPLQVKIARNIIDISDTCFVSNPTIKQEIQSYDPEKKVLMVPVTSNFGEPGLVNFIGRSPRRWAVCGGSKLIRRSLRSLAAALRMIPEIYHPEHLEVVGGHQDEGVRDLLRTMKQATPVLAYDYYPEITAERASEILAGCSFGWLDYFGEGRLWPGMVFKSSSFAAFCAHGTVPIFSHPEQELSLNGDLFPGPYFITSRAKQLPEPERLCEVRRNIYDWYVRNASSGQVARAYAEALS